MKTKAPALPPLSNGATYCTGPNGERVCTGSAMGRRDVLPEPAQRSQPCRLRLVNLREADRTGYDSGGAYWGCYWPRLGDKHGRMYRAVGDCGDVRAEVFVRALSRDDAKAKVRTYLPGATFFR